MIIIKNISKAFGNHSVIENLSFQIDKPGIYAVAGANGVGKSTLLRLLAGADYPDKGEISIDGISSLNRGNAYRKMVAWAPNNEVLFPFLKPIEIFRLFSKIYSEPLPQVNELIAHFRLTDFLNTKFSNLSSGNQKKVFLILALMHERKLVLLDEPFNALDKVAELYLVRLIKEASKKSIILMTTHQTEVIQSLDVEWLNLAKDGKGSTLNEKVYE